jgi:miniconductance mechanosensitive channel
MQEKETAYAYFIERWLIDTVGVDPEMTQLIKMVLLLAFVALTALIFWLIARFFINRFVKALVHKTATEWDDVLLERGVFKKLGHLVPAIVISVFTPMIAADYPNLVPYVEKLTSAYVAFTIIRLLVAIISSANIFLSRSKKFKDKPIASFTQLAKILVWLIGVVILFAIVLGKNPIYMFSALGAVSAVLLLIFKDTILGFIASIQLTINDMVRLGDWVSVPKYGADGDVIEINLTTIKVSNWDKTISTVPTYSFVSDSFKNWRGMQDSGGRRIKRAVFLKISKVKFCDDEMISRFSKISLVKPHIDRKLAEIKKHNEEHHIDTEGSLVNGRRMTNIGVFRAYVLAYIRSNPNINQDMTMIVRQLETTEKGVPLEVYCFSKIKTWVEYEGIQSDLFDHILAVVPMFDLEVFENPAGTDFRNFLNN